MRADPSAAQGALTKDDNPTGPGQSPQSGGSEQGQPWQAGGGETEEPDKREPPSGENDQKPDGGGQESGGGSDPVADIQEKLSQDRAQAGMAQAAGASEGAAGGDIEGEVTKQTSRINNWMLTIEPKLIAKDICTCGLALIITLPIRLIFVTILGLELKHAMNGTKSMIPFFPTLTWESFAPNGTDISIPLPLTPLYASVIAYFIAVVGAALVAASIIAIVYRATIGGAAYGFEFLVDLFAS